MTMSRGITTFYFITKVRVQTVQDQSNQLLSTQGAFEEIRAIVELECNEIISTWLFVFVFNFCFPLDDFLLLGSTSLCTKTPIHGKNINTNIL